MSIYFRVIELTNKSYTTSYTDWEETRKIFFKSFISFLDNWIKIIRHSKPSRTIRWNTEKLNYFEDIQELHKELDTNNIEDYELILQKYLNVLIYFGFYGIYLFACIKYKINEDIYIPYSNALEIHNLLFELDYHIKPSFNDKYFQILSLFYNSYDKKYPICVSCF
jgi:hypothetical protein